jgi:hypothetical protein|tara:strand:- start:221 stop:799 length:579 start_codon:yes stop_codon:yes gene_type:complete
MKTIFSVGVSDLKYQKTINELVDGKKKRVWICPFYDRWYSMLRRCYSSVYQAKQPTYKGCYVCEEWLTFSNFKQWMENQDWEGKVLDKDILGNGKLYSPENCCFITQNLNNFLTDRGNDRGDLPLGVTELRGKYIAQCKNPFNKDSRGYLGSFSSPCEAYKEYYRVKKSYAHKLAKQQDDFRIRDALIARFP